MIRVLLSRMSYYRETEENMNRDYKIECVLESKQTEKVLLEIVRTSLFGDALFLENQLQLTRCDEYIYHESLVHPVLTMSDDPSSVCILGGGDGCAVRELLKWSNVTSIHIYDWDKELVELFKGKYSSWNSQSLLSPRTHIHIQDVLEISVKKQFDIVIVDLLDPNYKDTYSRELWTSLIKRLPFLLKPTGSLVLNAGGITPWNTREVEWIIMLLVGAFRTNTTHVLEVYKTFIPSFASEWCFILIHPEERLVDTVHFQPCPSLRYFDETAWKMSKTWTKDFPQLPVQPIKLSTYLPPL